MSVSATGIISTIPQVNFLPRIQGLAVAFLALSTIQNLPKAEGNPIMWIKYAVTFLKWAKSAVPPFLRAAAIKAGGVLPYKQVANNAMNAIGVTSPYAKLAFQTGMLKTQYVIEDQACRKATEIYDKCTAKQVDALNECKIIDISQKTNIDLESNADSLKGKINSISKCDKINDKQGRDLCLSVIADLYNEQTSKEKDFKDPRVTECLKDNKNECKLAWIAQASVCLAEKVHSDITFGSIVEGLIWGK